eukprot:365865-Chlamydomonas_euryale.AAC.19
MTGQADAGAAHACEQADAGAAHMANSCSCTHTHLLSAIRARRVEVDKVDTPSLKAQGGAKCCKALCLLWTTLHA